MTKENDLAWAHGLARLGLGVNIALHGLTRLPDLHGFSTGLQEQFAKSILPSSWVYASGYGIAISEAVLGVLLIFGFLLRPTLIGGTLLMIILLFGSCLIQNWNAAGIQMTYLAFYAVLLGAASYDRFSVDGWVRKVFQNRDRVL